MNVSAKTRWMLLALVGVLILGSPCGSIPRADLVESLRTHVVYLASDSLEGRLVGTPGIEKASRYIAGQFEEIGLIPAFSGSYFQDFTIQFGQEVKSKPVLKIGDSNLSYLDDFAVIPISGSDTTSGDEMTVVNRRLPAGEPFTAPRLVLFLEDAEVEADRWTLMGHDGLIDWMRDASADAAERGAGAVVFVTGTPDDPDRGLHTFAVLRSHRAVEIPVFEATYAALEAALSQGGFRLRDIFEKGKPDEAITLLRIPPLRWELTAAVRPRTVPVKNMAGMIPGRDDRGFVVVGAHYDHLGYGDVASSTPWRREVHNGADDNASGVAAVIEIAREVTLAGGQAASVIFICFTAEELGALGSEHFCKNPPVTLDSTLAMINLDTVGRMEANKMIVFGARSAAEFHQILKNVNSTHQLELIEKQEIYGFSDQNPFYARGVPAVHFFTGAHDDYHSPADDWQKINFQGLGMVTAFVADFVRETAGIAKLTPVVEIEEKPRTEMGRGRGAYLGIVPDFTYVGTGVGIKGTVPRSPAETAGLKDGDVILAIDAKPIGDLKDLMLFLSGRSPDDEISIRVMRGSLAVTINATLSVRSERK
jgi:aminopeptidase YwaD